MTGLTETADLHARSVDFSLAATPAIELGIDSVSSAQYYELRLAPNQERVDYLFAVQRSAAVSAHARIAAHAQRTALNKESWHGIVRLLESWADGKSLTSVRVPTVWFESDCILGGRNSGIPSVCVCITSTYRVARPCVRPDPTDLRLPLEALRLLGAPLDAEGHHALSNAFSELPPSGSWIHLSYMLGRDPRATKLYGMLPRAELLDYLQRIGWAGDRGAIEHALGELYPAELLGEELYLDLNLDDFRDPKRCSLGLAVAQQHLLRGPDPDPTRGRILNSWVAAGLCDPAKIKPLADWPSSVAPIKPRAFQREARFVDLKLVWHAELGFVAKAYVGSQRSRGLF